MAKEAVLEPRAVKDCGCWNPGKLVDDETQELRDKLSDAVNADPASKGGEGGFIIQAIQSRSLVGIKWHCYHRNIE